MDRNRFSAIAHRHHAFSNPINEAKMMKMIDMVSLKPQEKVIDIGAGKCELLIRLVDMYNISGTAIELYDGAIEEAKRNASNRIPEGSIAFIVDDAKVAVEDCEKERFDLAMCIGSTHALGGLESTLRYMKHLVKKNGYILIGEGYWKQRPSADYLQALGGAEESELKSHAENVRTGEELGFVPLWSYVANEDDWDDYEWLYSSSIENYCHENPNDPDHDAMLVRIRAWRRTYLKWGRDTLGFGLYLFRT
ncbi:class I SAM-dependent methyltransferase [Neobacillus sp. MM2021_6]|uniref:SAM-dependent methyltransferase n=1 Tax=Bacillaceae TaxID=186817 RepID=UPI001407EA38|nr:MULTISPECIES: class I SAM-dependent methyltransferase [Bacillaceae]MBO0962660.1 class I SAM-dependent methyltransferase [Neobacillus sp. MM2021_6]NHC21412.1 class I SAM-dependent methyltransferase [Bacillus sp. MM2020_4]